MIYLEPCSSVEYYENNRGELMCVRQPYQLIPHYDDPSRSRSSLTSGVRGVMYHPGAAVAEASDAFCTWVITSGPPPMYTPRGYKGGFWYKTHSLHVNSDTHGLHKVGLARVQELMDRDEAKKSGKVR